MKEDQMPLHCATDPAWADVALADFDAFLLDHAACERKASALAMSFVVKYPDRLAMIEPMICLAKEELAHFHEVYLLIAKRGLELGPDFKDPYLNRLLKHVRHGRDDHFLDRLLVSSIVEARGCERFHIVAKVLPDSDLKAFYTKLAKAEAGHFMVFLRVARQYFSNEVVEKRLEELLAIEASIVTELPHRSAVH
jgi:tRNA 2-(methylsulfanyl)-N6-isopentenyladenosine37 hydroxylase